MKNIPIEIVTERYCDFHSIICSYFVICIESLVRFFYPEFEDYFAINCYITVFTMH